LRIYGDFSIFEHSGRRHVGFLNFEILTVGTLKRVNCVTMPNVVASGQPMRRYGDFSTFKMAAATILDLQIFIILTVGTLKRFTLRYVPNVLVIGQTFAKICRFFHFSNMVAFRHLGFVMRVFGPHTKGI